MIDSWANVCVCECVVGGGCMTYLSMALKKLAILTTSSDGIAADRATCRNELTGNTQRVLTRCVSAIGANPFGGSTFFQGTDGCLATQIPGLGKSTGSGASCKGC